MYEWKLWDWFKERFCPKKVFFGFDFYSAATSNYNSIETNLSWANLLFQSFSSHSWPCHIFGLKKIIFSSLCTLRILIVVCSKHIYIYDDKRTAPDLLSVMIGFSWKFVDEIFDIFFLTFDFISLLNLVWEVIEDSKQWT